MKDFLLLCGVTVFFYVKLEECNWEGIVVKGARRVNVNVDRSLKAVNG